MRQNEVMVVKLGDKFVKVTPSFRLKVGLQLAQIVLALDVCPWVIETSI